MESELIEKRLLEVEKTAAESRVLAKEAMDTAKAGLVKQTENEQRLKSIQHRVDHTEGKMDTMLDWISRIDGKITHSNSVQEGIRRTLKVFMGLVSVISVAVGIVRLIIELS